MRSWSRLVVVGFLVLVAAGCGSKKSAPADQAGSASASAAAGPIDPLVAEVLDGLKGFRDTACACLDEVCADKAMNAMGQWLLTQGEHFKPVDQKATPAQQAEAKKLTAEMTECARKLADAAAAAPKQP